MTFPTAAVEPAPRRRRRWPWVMLIALVLVAALVVAAEAVARAVVPEVVRSAVVSQIDLPPGSEVEVETTGLLLPQLLSGRLDSLDLASDAVQIGPLVAAVQVTAADVPVDAGAFGGADGTARVTEEEFFEVLAASDLPLEELTLEDGVVTLGGTVSVFGAEIPLAVGVEPEIDAGDLLLRPVSFEIAGAAVDVAELTSRFGEFGAQFAGPFAVCVEDRMPAGITLTSIAIDGGEVSVGFVVDGRITVDAALQQSGTCP